jgi:SAM-dependent methyltransferase
MERAVFNRMAEVDQDHWWFLARRRILHDVIDRIARPPSRARILEVGCGTGHNLGMLSGFGIVDACELDTEARALASKRLGKPVKTARLPDLSMFSEDAYDAIALLDVLEHVEDDLGALIAIQERLKPGGALIVTVPANEWMWSAHDVAHHHYRRYSKAALARLYRRVGLEIELHSYFNSLLFPPIAAVRLIGKVLNRESSDDAMPADVINATLNGIFALERHLIGRVPMPFGLSLISVLRRPQSQQ